MDTPYRSHVAPTPRASWLWRLDSWWLPLRSAQWFRRAVGGAWTLRGATLIPGCPTWWHCDGVDPATSSTFAVFAREAW